jgi:hypothetical protein
MFKEKLVLFLFVVYSMPALAVAERFNYSFAEKETLTYILTADSHVDLNKLGAIAAILQITNLSQNTYIAADLTTESTNKNGESSQKALFRQVSLVMIKNDSIQTSNGSSWGGIKPGSIHRFGVAQNGKINPVMGKSGQVNPSMYALWQFLLPVFPSRAIDKEDGWVDTVKFPLQISGMAPCEVVCRLNFTYVGKDSKSSGAIDRFEYAIAGNSPQNKNLQITGVGHIRFDRAKGQLIENNCDFEMQGMVDLTTMGLPAELNSSLPLLIKSKASAKLQNAN